jgi:hypothetical protein
MHTLYARVAAMLPNINGKLKMGLLKLSISSKSRL